MMLKILPRRDEPVEETVFLRPQRPDDHRDFETLLPWMTPLFTYPMDGKEWVRWHLPLKVGQRLGLDSDAGCACCGESTVLKVDGGFQVDTAWCETSWWLERNDYALSPTEGKSHD